MKSLLAVNRCLTTGFKRND